MTLIEKLTKVIHYCFYALILLVPLIFTNTTSELFELNKMWLTWALALIIFFAWTSKIILEKQIRIRRTPFEIPILLFLLSQVISTILSIDPRTSLWGYYSRFNGGLYSLITYGFLYFALVSNFKKEQIITLTKVGLIACLITLLWGIPSHFGKDPTCALFRYDSSKSLNDNLNVDCWTNDFKPTVRIFSTLGQPAWMAAYVNVFIPISLAMLLFYILRKDEKRWYFVSAYGIFTAALYLAEIYTNTRAGFIAFWAGNIAFWIVLFLRGYLKNKSILYTCLLIQVAYLVITFFNLTPFEQLNKFTLPNLMKPSAQSVATQTASPSASPVKQSVQTGATDSAVIRQYVWKGAIDMWKAHPLFGTGVETFAYAYYQYRPIGHNLTSEWDFLYNKAHNEYLNYLGTTGTVGLGTYLLMIGMFLYWSVRYLLTAKKTEEPDYFLILAFVIGYGTILITNFFGFSVVIMNLYLFLIPGMCFLLSRQEKETDLLYPKASTSSKYVTSAQWTAITLVGIIIFWMLVLLFRYWQADKKYALAHNLNGTGTGQYLQQSYTLLEEAHSLWPHEPVILDELSQTSTTLAMAFYAQKDATNAAQFANQARDLSNTLVETYPYNVVLWKSRVRIFYSLSTADPAYLPQALSAIDEAAKLAPTDAKILYNQGVLYGQTDRLDEGIRILEKTASYRPQYRDPHYALALFYRQKATENGDRVVHPEYEKKAVGELYYILENLSETDTPSLQLLELWKEPKPTAN